MTINAIITIAFKKCHDTLDMLDLPYSTRCEECPKRDDCIVGCRGVGSVTSRMQTRSIERPGATKTPG